MVYLIYLILLVFSLGQLTRLPFSNGEVNIYLPDLLMGGLIVAWLGEKLLRREKIKWPSLTKYILGFITFALFSLLLAIPYFTKREVMVAACYLVRWSAYSLIYFILSDHFKNEKMPGSKFIVLNLLIFSGFMAALLGLLQYLFLPDIRALTQFDWDPHYYRVVGTYLDPGFTGLIYVLTLILLIHRIWETKKLRQLLFMLGFAVVYLSLVLTYARSAYLAYLVGLGIIAWQRKSVKFFGLMTGLFLVTILILPRPGGEGVKLERRSTVWARINNWQQSIKIGLHKPVFGIGFNTYRYTQRNLGFLDQNWAKTHAGAGADSSLLFVFATCGIIGLISYLLLLLRISGEALRTKSILILACGAALLINSFFTNSLFYLWLMIWWLTALAIFKESS